MKRKILLTILSLMLLSTGVLFSLLACSIKNEAVPQDFTFQNRVITWGEVERAKGYVVMLDGKEYETEKNSFDTLPYIKDAGEYFVEVKAVFDGGENGAFAKYRFDVTEPLKSGYDEKGFSYTLLEDKSGYEISKGTADLSGALVIPDYFDGLPVTKIADYAFSTHIKLIYPNPITDYGCNTKTLSVSIGSKVKTIGQRAFAGFSMIKSLVIPSNVTEIGKEAFFGCSRLELVFLPDGFKEIPEGCFSDCALKQINFPKGLEKIGASAFMCNAYTQNGDGGVLRTNQSFTDLCIPESVKYMGDNAFNGCQKLENIDLQGDFSYFGSSVFGNTPWYEAKEDGIVTIGSVLYGVKGDAAWLFLNYRINELTVPEDITCIAAEAFYNIDIRSVIIHDGVAICNKAFCYSRLFKVRLPSDIEVLYDYAFANINLNGKTIVLPKTLKKVSVTAFKKANLINIFYEGNYNEWKKLFEFDTQPELFVELVSSKTTLYFYSETEPEEKGNYWHYVDGEPTVW